MKKSIRKSIRAVQAERYLRYGIRKFSFGVASVAIASGMLFLERGVSAAEVTDTVTHQAVTENSVTATTEEKANTEKKSQEPLATVKARLIELAQQLNDLQEITAKDEVATQALIKLVAAVQDKIASGTDAIKLEEFVQEVNNQRNQLLLELNRKENGQNSPLNGQPMSDNAGVALRANTNPTVGEAQEGPTSHNKLGYKNNPATGVFNSAKDQFGEINFSDAVDKKTDIEKQWNSHSNFAGTSGPVELGKVTYHWKEKKITKEEAANGSLAGWKIEGNQDYVIAVKPEAPTGLAADRPVGYDPIPGKVYDNGGTIERKYDTTNVGAGVNNVAQNYANGLDMQSVGRVDKLAKGYYLELGKKGNKISKEFEVNGNSRLFLNVVSGGVYGNAGTAATGERIKITLLDADTNQEIPSIQDDLGGGNEKSHIASPDARVWNSYRAIYNTFASTKRVKLILEALDDGTAFNHVYHSKDKTQVEDGYLIGSVNLSVGSGTESTTNVVSDNKQAHFGDKNLYKRSQKGTFDFTVNNVGGNTHYGFAVSEIIVPEGVELPDTITKATGWVWLGNTPVNSDNIIYDQQTRKLTIKYNTSPNNDGKNPQIGPGSNNGKNDGVRSFSIPFVTTDDYKGTATFKLRTYLPNGFLDAEGNEVLITNDFHDNEQNPKRYRNPVSGLLNSDNPNFYYNKTIYIDTKKPTVVAAETVHTDHIMGDSKETNQAKQLLITPPTEDGITNANKEKANLAELNQLNGTATTYESVEAALGGVQTMTVALPNGAKAITLVKKSDGWYQGNTKLEEQAGKLVLPLPADVNLDEANDITNQEKRIKITATDKAGNVSDPVYVTVINEAPKIQVKTPKISLYKTATNLTSDTVIAKVGATATDLEDDRDGVESTKPVITADVSKFDTTKAGTYTVPLTVTDSEGKTATTNITIQVYDLITVDPTVTSDPTEPSTTDAVSPKAENTPVKAGDTTRGTYPAGVTKDDLVKEVTRTIKYLKETDKDKENAEALAPEKVQKVTYKRTATVNPDTKEVTYSEWTVYEGANRLVEATNDGTFKAVASPVVKGYLLVTPAEKTITENVAPKPGADKSGNVTNEVQKVLYKEIGAFVPVYPEGKKPKDAENKIPYPNHPDDPTKPGDFGNITIPYVPGYTPVIGDKELEPNKPNDPRNGYKIPTAPGNNFENTKITYVPSMQTVTVVIKTKEDETAEELLHKTLELKGKAGSDIPKDNPDVQAVLTELKGKGYQITSNEFAKADKFDDNDDIVPKNIEDATNEGAEGQVFTIVLTARVETVMSDTPKDKNSLVDGDKNPELKWPAGVEKGDLNKKITRTIHFVKKDGPTEPEQSAKEDVTQEVNYKRNATVNLVTKQVTYTEWTTANKEVPTYRVPVLTGYLSDKKEVAAATTTTPAEDGTVTPLEDVKVTYTKIGTWIPVNPNGGEAKPIPYPNNPDDPTKPGVITETIPYVPGYTPKNQNGEPLTEKNPGHPEEGYNPPAITNPNEDIKISYEKDNQKAIVKFVTVDPVTKAETELAKEQLVLNGKTGETIDAASVTEKLVELDNYGYKQVENPFETPQLFDDKKDGEDNPSQVFVVKVMPRVSTTNPVYVVEGETPEAIHLNAAVTPAKGGTVTELTDKDVLKAIPTTNGKGGQTLEISTQVVYGNDANKRTEEVKIPVIVLPKATAETVVVPKGTSKEILTAAIKAKVQKALTNIQKLPADISVSSPADDALQLPNTSQVGEAGDVEVTVNYNGEHGRLLLSSAIKVPVTVVASKVTPLVVFEGDEITAEMAKGAVSETHGGEVQTPSKFPLTNGKAGATDVSVKATVKHLVGDTEVSEEVEIPVTVLPLAKPKLVIVAKNSDKEALKQQVLGRTKEAITSNEFTSKLPQGARVEIDTTKDINIPDLIDDTDVRIPIRYIVDGQVYTTEVEVPVEVVEGFPQYVAANDDNGQPDVKKSIDPDDYPEGSTFKYKESVNTTTAGLKDATVIVAKDGETLVEVPVKVAVVESTPRYIVQTDQKEKLTNPEMSITSEEYPEGATFEYDGEVDTTVLGTQMINVVVKSKEGQPIVTVPADIIVVNSTHQYVPVSKENRQPEPKEQITPDAYPLDATFEYAKPIDTATVGEKDGTIIVKDENGKVIVAVPAKVTVVEGKTQTIPVNDEQPPKAEESVTPSDYPEGSTFEYKMPVDRLKVGEQEVVVVVKDKNGKVLVEVPAKVIVVDGNVTPIETPVTKTPLTPEDIESYVKIPAGSHITKVGEIPNVSTPGNKPEVEVEITLENGKKIIKKVPVTVTPVTPIETPVTKTPLTPEVIQQHITIPIGGKVISVSGTPDLTTPGEKTPIKVIVELPGGKQIEVEVPVTVTPVKEIETPVTKTPLTPEDIKNQIPLPSGSKVISVGKVPSVDTEGDKGDVSVIVELPGGERVEVPVHVTVTPVTPIEVPQGTPITPADIHNHVKIPAGGNITQMSDVPSTDKPGEKPSVTVVITLPGGKHIEVEIPVTVLPHPKELVVPQGTPIMPEDIRKQIDLPENWNITKVGEIPTTTVPGTKPSVSVEVELPNGKRIIVEVPIVVTPKVTLIVVELGTPITEKDVITHIDLPEGWTVVKVGEIPTTDTLGVRPGVPVTIQMPNGKIVTVTVPVQVIPVRNAEVPVEPSMPSENGNMTEQPDEPSTPSEHGDMTSQPAGTSDVDTNQTASTNHSATNQSTSDTTANQSVLPNTGSRTSLGWLAAVASLMGVGLLTKKGKKEQE